MGELLNRFILLALAITPLAHADRRLVSIADRRLSIDCTGAPSPHTVILIASQGRTMQDWSKVQPALSGFTRVCTYDRAGFGESDKPRAPQSMAEIVDNLHQLLASAHEKPPYILVGHSIAGIICRRSRASPPGRTPDSRVSGANSSTISPPVPRAANSASPNTAAISSSWMNRIWLCSPFGIS